MTFTSFAFIAFVGAVILVYALTPPRARWGMLLAASYVFYASFGLAYVPLLAAATLFTWWIGLRIGRLEPDDAPAVAGAEQLGGLSVASSAPAARRRRMLAFGLVVLLGLLAVFKYANFATGSTASFLVLLGIDMQAPAVHWLLPVGISFYTFMGAGYLIDVFRGRITPQQSVWSLALFMSFFPHITAGPIDRAPRFLPQLRTKSRFDYSQVSLGLKQILWGFVMKVVIADRLALAVDRIFANPSDYRGWMLVLAAYGFSFQIYCDFAGYSLIAIGLGHLFGLNLMQNFNRPYLSENLQEFWHRWHISLSTWFRDYVYIPLGGNRVTKWRQDYNILVVFLLSGLWHGAAWTFVIWGGLHGIYLIVGERTAAARERFAVFIGLARLPRLRKAWKVFATFNLVTFAWIFFKIQSFSDAGTYLKNMISPGVSVSTTGLRQGDSVIIVVTIGALLLAEYRAGNRPMVALLNERAPWIRMAAYSLLLWTVVLGGKFGAQEFIYGGF
ncbi:MAG: MBOAT family O-acyltransferase [Acidimicrobiia bacterium]